MIIITINYNYNNCMIIITSTVVVLDCDSKVTQYCSISETNANLNKLIKMTTKTLQRYLVDYLPTSQSSLRGSSSLVPMVLPSCSVVGRDTLP